MTQIDTDVYRVHVGDAVRMLKRLPAASVDAIITDPPYGATNLPWDRQPALTWVNHLQCLKPGGMVISFANWNYARLLQNRMPLPFCYELVWVKNTATGFLGSRRRPLRNHEFIMIFGGRFYRPIKWPRGQMNARIGWKRASYCMSGRHWNQVPRTAYYYGRSEYPKSALSVPRTGNGGGGGKHHSTEKPVALLAWLVRSYTPRGGLVVDPYMGLGSTGVACVAHGRRFIGCEINRSDAAVARRKIREAFMDTKSKTRSVPNLCASV